MQKSIINKYQTLDKTETNSASIWPVSLYYHKPVPEWVRAQSRQGGIFMKRVSLVRFDFKGNKPNWRKNVEKQHKLNI